MDMPGNLVAAIKVASEREWDEMWDKVIAEKAMQIAGRHGAEQLLALQAEVKLLQEVKNWFKSERHR